MTTLPPTDQFSLRDSLAVVLPHLSDQLASPPVVRQMQALADTLLPIPRALLECHLRDTRQRVDVSQCIFSAERDWFAAFAHERGGWQNIAALANQWRNPTSPLAEGIEHIWLEFDTGGSRLPGVFLKLHEADGQQIISEVWPVAQSALRLLLPDGAAWDKLHQCFEAAADVAVITHLGVMLSRSSRAVRLNVALPSAAAAAGYLTALDWPGLPPPFAEVFAQAFDCAPHSILTFDVDTAVAQRIGLECVPGHRYLIDDGWDRFFRFLLEHHLCSVEQIAALRAWPGYSDPTHSANWPVSLMLKSLAQPTASLDVLIRQLNHVKLVFQPNAPTITAKAYLGYSHENLNPAELVRYKNTPPS